MPNSITLAHDLDAAWILALWLAIHGGDPPPPIEIIVAEAISALVKTAAGIPSEAGGATFAQLQGRLKEIGVDIQTQTLGKTESIRTESVQLSRTYCIVFKGQRICITLPVVKAPWPPPGN